MAKTDQKNAFSCSNTPKKLPERITLHLTLKYEL